MSRGSASLRAPLVAAVLLSAAAHAAVVWMADARAPVGRTDDAPATLRVRVSPAPPPALSASAAVEPPVHVAALERASPRIAPSAVRSPAPRASGAVAPTAAPAAPPAATTDDAAVDRGPKPLTYPVLSLPPDDDPRRVGLVRLMLVVSSEGRVVKTVVTAATLSQDYVDRIAESFGAVRFEPATVHGLPRASWYEVVVDFTFDPEARAAI